MIWTARRFGEVYEILEGSRVVATVYDAEDAQLFLAGVRRTQPEPDRCACGEPMPDQATRCPSCEQSTRIDLKDGDR